MSPNTIASTFFDDVRNILARARGNAYTAVNFAMVEAYWQIGRRIVEEEQNGADRAEYGRAIIKELSKRLTSEFGKGFAVSNLWNFRQFYLTFPEEKLYAPRRELTKSYAARSLLTWTHYRLIMRVENPLARDYYLRETAEQNWSTRQLERNIHSLYYERLLMSPDKKTALIKEHGFERQYPAEFIKDPYVLEFLQIPETVEFSERELETAIINNLQRFLLEFGKGFAYIGRQFRISTETSHFYIDLVFYNYLLKCFVLIDLKSGKLSHQDIGQMDMYVRMFDDLKRGEDDNPTIGIILCSAQDETVVKYSVLKDSEQIFASRYRLVLPSEEELAAEIDRQRRRIMEQHATYRVRKS